MRIGTMLSMPGDLTLTGGLIERAAKAEAAGFASAWLPQVSSVDALTVLALAGRETSTIELGTAVVPTYPRHPTVVAMQALTAQDACGGRLALGLGLSHRIAIEDALGLDYSHPVAHAREYLTILDGLLDGRRVEYRGERYRVATQVTLPGVKRPPVLFAALGPAMLKLCGRLTDGTVTWMGGTTFLRDVAVPLMCGAAEDARRPAPRFVAMVPVLLTRDEAAGRELINTAFRIYGTLPSYRATLDRGGAEVPADVAVVGDEGAVEAGLAAYEAAGATDFVAVIPPGAGADGEATYELLAARARTTSP